jgi:hypothetical protein
MEKLKENIRKLPRVKILVSLALVIITCISYLGHTIQKLEIFYFDTTFDYIKVYTQICDLMLLIIFGILLGISSIDKKKIGKLVVLVISMLSLRIIMKSALFGKWLTVEELLSLNFISIFLHLSIIIVLAILVHFIVRNKQKHQLVFSPTIIIVF